jgi:hypothetical protein
MTRQRLQKGAGTQRGLDREFVCFQIAMGRDTVPVSMMIIHSGS